MPFVDVLGCSWQASRAAPRLQAPRRLRGRLGGNGGWRPVPGGISDRLRSPVRARRRTRSLGGAGLPSVAWRIRACESTSASNATPSRANPSRRAAARLNIMTSDPATPTACPSWTPTASVFVSDISARSSTLNTRGSSSRDATTIVSIRPGRPSQYSKKASHEHATGSQLGALVDDVPGSFHDGAELGEVLSDDLRGRRRHIRKVVVERAGRHLSRFRDLANSDRPVVRDEAASLHFLEQPPTGLQPSSTRDTPCGRPDVSCIGRVLHGVDGSVAADFVIGANASSDTHRWRRSRTLGPTSTDCPRGCRI